MNTEEEFNKKWEAHLEEGHYGMSIGIPEVIKYMDEEFEKELLINPEFKYTQIKEKFNMARVYVTSERTDEWESRIDAIILDWEKSRDR